MFTNEIGKPLSHNTISNHFKRIVKSIDVDMPFHGLRHSYAVMSLAADADIKSIQENMGHHSAAFTLDTYAHATDRMKQESANRMESFINAVKLG